MRVSSRTGGMFLPLPLYNIQCRLIVRLQRSVLSGSCFYGPTWWWSQQVTKHFNVFLQVKDNEIVVFSVVFCRVDLFLWLVKYAELCVLSTYPSDKFTFSPTLLKALLCLTTTAYLFVSETSLHLNEPTEMADSQVLVNVHIRIICIPLFLGLCAANQVTSLLRLE